MKHGLAARPPEFRFLEARKPRNHDERIHRLRVRAKQLRAWLGLLRPFLGKEQFKRHETELRNTARRLAPQRDRTVILLQLAAISKKLPSKEKQNARKFISLLDSRAAPRRGEHLALRRAGARLKAVLKSLPRAESLARDARPFSEPGLRWSYQHARRALSRAAKSRKNEDFHRLRKHAKYFFLQLKIVEQKLPHLDRGQLLRKLDSFQDDLGKYHDMALAQDFLETAETSKRRSKDSCNLRRRLQRELRRKQKRLLRKGQKIFQEKPRPRVGALY